MLWLPRGDTADTGALQCDGCDAAGAWKCMECLKLTVETYNALIAECKDLKWFCPKCEKSLITHTDSTHQMNRLGDIMNALERILEHLNKMDEKLKDKADKITIEQIDSRISVMEMKLKDMTERGTVELLDKRIITLEERTTQITNRLEQKIYEQKSVEKCEGTNTLKEDDKLEAEEQTRRKQNVIVHGLPESDDNEVEQRTNDDLNQIAMLLNDLKCENTMVIKAIRLGRRPETITGNGKPRPLKLVLGSEEQKTTLLGEAKNLKRIKEGLWKNIFIHKDQTPKERDALKTLLEELKTRSEAGETDIILVRGRIVKKYN